MLAAGWGRENSYPAREPSSEGQKFPTVAHSARQELWPVHSIVCCVPETRKKWGTQFLPAGKRALG